MIFLLCTRLFHSTFAKEYFSYPIALFLKDQVILLEEDYTTTKLLDQDIHQDVQFQTIQNIICSQHTTTTSPTILPTATIYKFWLQSQEVTCALKRTIDEKDHVIDKILHFL